MRPTSKRLFAGLLALLLLCPALRALAGDGDPYVPADDAVVLEQLPAALGPGASRLRALRRQLERNPQDLRQAIAYAQAAIELGRQEQDPRDFGYAQAALAPWSQRADAPSRVVLLRATLEQWRHDFPAALRDLDALVAADADEAIQAHLTRASLRLVRGDPVGALRDCVALIGRTDLLSASTCIAQANSLRGRAATSLDSLRAVLGQAAAATGPRSGITPGVRLWALTTAAEIAARTGRQADAAQWYQAALAQMDAAGTRDPYLLASVCDYWLDQGQAQAVAQRLAGLERIDNLLLRLALAQQQLAATGTPGAAQQRDAQVQALAQRFAEARQRGDGSVHLREEARFELQLRHDPAQALRLALQNWQAQREPADALVLLQAAMAKAELQAAAPVLDWMRATGIEDLELAALAQRLHPRRDA